MNQSSSKTNSMTHISDLFSKYRTRFLPPQASVEQAAITAIHNATNLALKSNQVTYQPSTRVLVLTVPSIMKTEIFFNKKVILRELSINLGAKNAPTTLL